MSDDKGPADWFAVALLVVAIGGIVGALAFPGAAFDHEVPRYAAWGQGCATIAAGAIIGMALLRRGR